MNNYNKYSDEQLVGLLREQRPACDQAFFVLYNRYSLKLNTYCLFFNRTGESAEDVFQETWIRFDQTVKSGKNIKNILNFLVTVAKNITIDKHRKRTAQKVIKADQCDSIPLERIPDHLQFDNDLENDELISLIKIAANSLDDKYKETFVLRRFCDMSYKEISELTGVSVAGTKKRASRALEKIKDILEPYIKELS